MRHPVKNMGIRISEESLEKLRYIAKCERRSVSSMIRVLVYACVREFEEKHGTIDIS